MMRAIELRSIKFTLVTGAAALVLLCSIGVKAARPSEEAA